MFEIIRRAGPLFFSTSNYIAPLVGVGLGMLLFGDTYSLWIWAALLLMFLGLFASIRLGRGKSRRSSERSYAGVLTALGGSPCWTY